MKEGMNKGMNETKKDSPLFGLEVEIQLHQPETVGL